jgi:hypothetical protein
MVAVKSPKSSHSFLDLKHSPCHPQLVCGEQADVRAIGLY